MRIPATNVLLAKRLTSQGWKKANETAFVDPANRENLVKDARNLYHKAAELDPSSMVPPYLLAHSYLYNHEYARAERASAVVSSILPTYWQNLYLRGLIHEASWSYARASIFFEQLLLNKFSLVSVSSVYIYHLMLFYRHIGSREFTEMLYGMYERLGHSRGFGGVGARLDNPGNLDGGKILVWLTGGPGDQIRTYQEFNRIFSSRVNFEVIADPRLHGLIASSTKRNVTFRERDGVDRSEPVCYQFQGMNRHLLGWNSRHSAKLSSRRDFWDRVAERRQPGRGLRVGVSWRTFRPTERRMSAAVDCWRLSALAKNISELWVLQSDASAGEMAHLHRSYGIKVRRPDFDAYNDIDQLAELLKSLDLVITIGNSIRDLSGFLEVPTISITVMPGLLDSWRIGQDGIDIFQDYILHYGLRQHRSRASIFEAIDADLSSLVSS